MNLSNNGERILKNKEGLKLFAYCDKCGKRVRNSHDTCSGGYATIGYGHKIRPAEMSLYCELKKELTKAEAETIFQNDIRPFKDVVNKAITKPLTQNQFDALVIFAFNIGIGGFKGSTVARYINAGRPLADIEKWWLVWCHGDDGEVIPGLLQRRKDEFGLFKTP